MNRTLIAFALTTALAGGAVGAEEHVVEMLNKNADGERMVFEPAVIDANPGDTVRFVPADRGHNAASLRGGLPEGAESFRGGMGKELVVEITETGLHLVQCNPHYGAGMIALIVSGGDFSNEAAVRDAVRPPKAEERLDAYLERARAASAG